VSTNMEEFLNWFKKTLLDLCAGPSTPASQWFNDTTGGPPSPEAAQWVDDLFAPTSPDIVLPAPAAGAWPNPLMNAKLYFDEVSAAISALVALGADSDDPKAADWFASAFTTPRTVRPSTNVPQTVRDWMRRSVPGSITETVEISLKGYFEEESDEKEAVLVIAGKAVKVKAPGAAFDLLLAVATLDTVQRIGHPVRHGLVRLARAAIADIGQTFRPVKDELGGERLGVKMPFNVSARMPKSVPEDALKK
jgi:hypothetical protein